MGSSSGWEIRLGDAVVHPRVEHLHNFPNVLIEPAQLLSPRVGGKAGPIGIDLPNQYIAPQPLRGQQLIKQRGDAGVQPRVARVTIEAHHDIENDAALIGRKQRRQGLEQTQSPGE